MKRIAGRLLSVLLTLAMLLSMMPIAYATDLKLAEVTTEDELTEAVAAGSVVLGDDVTLTSALTISTKVTIDLNGHGLTSEDYDNGYAISIEDDAEVTIEGEGTIKGIDSFYAIQSNGGILNVNGGTIHTINMNGNGKVIITGGTIEKNSDGSMFTGKISGLTITGGTFAADPTGYVTGDSTVTLNEDGTYGVESGTTAAVIGKTLYKSLDAALDAAEEGQTVVVMKNTSPSYLIVKTGVTLDLNGKAVTAEMAAVTGAIIDSMDGTATLTIGKNNLFIYGENRNYMPLYDKNEGNYRFFSFTLTPYDSVEYPGTNQARFWFKFGFTNKDAFQYFSQARENGVKLNIAISWTGVNANTLVVDGTDILSAIPGADKDDDGNSVWISLVLKNYHVVGEGVTFSSEMNVESRAAWSVKGAGFEHNGSVEE